jgi:hypothetical protein
MEELAAAAHRAPWRPTSLKEIKAGKSVLGLFALLPRDVRQLLLSYMHPVALSRLARCSSALRELCDDEKFWESPFYARGAHPWERSQYDTFKQAYTHRFGPLDRRAVAAAARWQFWPINAIRDVLKPNAQKHRILMLGLDAAGKTTILCER